MWIKRFNIIIWAFKRVLGFSYKKYVALVAGDQLAKAFEQGWAYEKEI